MTHIFAFFGWIFGFLNKKKVDKKVEVVQEVEKPKQPRPPIYKSEHF